VKEKRNFGQGKEKKLPISSERKELPRSRWFKKMTSRKEKLITLGREEGGNPPSVGRKKRERGGKEKPSVSKKRGNSR